MHIPQLIIMHIKYVHFLDTNHICKAGLVVCSFFEALGIEPNALCMLGKHSTSGLTSHPNKTII
jgi:hypothetical protein